MWRGSPPRTPSPATTAPRRSTPPPASRSATGYRGRGTGGDRKSTRLNSSHLVISYAVFCLKKKKQYQTDRGFRDYEQRAARPRGFTRAVSAPRLTDRFQLPRLLASFRPADTRDVDLS